jgi:tripartite-type tricarboxylate transporter receptor subunit TctC
VKESEMLKRSDVGFAADPSRRGLLRAAIATAGMAALGPARAQGAGYPKGPIRIIVGLPVGGSADVVVRATALQLEKSLKQPVLVENRPGGQFAIAMQALASAPADGHTILHIYNGFPATQATRKLFDLEKQTTAVAMTYSTPMVLMVRADSPYKTLGEAFAYARANPGRLSYGVLGAAGLEHLKFAQIEKAAGFRGLSVPYKGGPDIVQALIAGDIDIAPAAAIFTKIHAGRVKALAVLEPQRWRDLPDVPTLDEAGVKVDALSYWGGYVVRSGTPKEIVTLLSSELAAATQSPATIERLVATGHSTRFSKSPDDFQQYIRSELAWMSEAAKLVEVPAN